MSARLKLELVAQPGAAPDALLARERRKGDYDRLQHLADDLLPCSARYDAHLSYDWGMTVICTPEFSAWWRGRADQPSERIFLEVPAA